jgi:hypothetical protein
MQSNEQRKRSDFRGFMFHVFKFLPCVCVRITQRMVWQGQLIEIPLDVIKIF